MSTASNHNSYNDSPAGIVKLQHTAADILEQTLVTNDNTYSRNLQNALISEDDSDVQSETSTVNNQQLELGTNATALNSFPTDTICGQIEINDSQGNHIGTKIVASNLIVINKNTSTTNPKLKKNESATTQTTSILKTVHCSKLAILSSVIIIVFTFVKFYDFNTSTDKRKQIFSSSNVTIQPILTSTETIMEPKLPDPWIISRAQWGAVNAPRTSCRGYSQAISVLIGDTKTNTCESISDCSKIIRQIQSTKMMNLTESKCDIDYNFLIGYDSRIYEGLAWNATKIWDPHAIVKIAFIGDYSSTGRNDVLTDNQVFSFLKFLEKSQNEQRFKMSYSVRTECCSDNVKSPGDNILISMISWNTNKLSLECIAENRHYCCGHLQHYYYLHHLDKYKYVTE